MGMIFAQADWIFDRWWRVVSVSVHFQAILYFSVTFWIFDFLNWDSIVKFFYLLKFFKGFVKKSIWQYEENAINMLYFLIISNLYTWDFQKNCNEI